VGDRDIRRPRLRAGLQCRAGFRQFVWWAGNEIIENRRERNAGRWVLCHDLWAMGRGGWKRERAGATGEGGFPLPARGGRAVKSVAAERKNHGVAGCLRCGWREVFVAAIDQRKRDARKDAGWFQRKNDVAIAFGGILGRGRAGQVCGGKFGSPFCDWRRYLSRYRRWICCGRCCRFDGEKFCRLIDVRRLRAGTSRGRDPVPETRELGQPCHGFSCTIPRVEQYHRRYDKI